jgi:hypothetical protein
LMEHVSAFALVAAAFAIGYRLSLEPIREVRIHEEGFAAASRRSMMRIMARRTKAATVVA